MKETPLSTCEKNFIVQAIKQNLRLDGRKNDEFRPIKINYGADWGSVMVSLGETKVLAQVSSVLGVPKATRPNEGLLQISVELGPMAASHFEAGRNCEVTVQLNRTLDRVFKDSRSIDLESLCIQSEERVWILRVDINVLNHEGNLIDCCSIAMLCALMHFRRPDVSLIEDDIVIHTAAEKEPIPMVMHHYPVCVSYCTFDDGRIAVADPTIMEEKASESQMIFGINSYRELCCLNLGGSSLTSSTLLLQSSIRASIQAKKVVDFVKQTLEKDLAARETQNNVGFTQCLTQNITTTLAEDRLALKLRHFTFDVVETEEQKRRDEFFKKLSENDDESNDTSDEITLQDMEATKLTLGNEPKWVPTDASNDDHMAAASNSEDESSAMQSVQNSNANKNRHSSKKKNINKVKKREENVKRGTISDSEEEEQIVL